MKAYTAKLESVTPIAFGRYYVQEVPEQPKESKDEYEKRTWRYRAHVNEAGKVLITPLAIKNCLTSVAKYLGEQIPGKGKSTYTKHFASGVLVTDPIVLPVTRDQLEGKWIHVPSDGMRGGSKRVLKCFPVIEKWAGSVKIFVFDETVTQDVLKKHLIEAGNFIGLGSLRVQNNGIYGRFKVVSLIETKD
jgi:hypothetical protein